MKKVLIVEDDQLIATIYQDKISNQGFEVEKALDGETGIETFKTFQPDLVLLDLMLPKLSGLEVVKAIRAAPGGEKLPILVLTGSYFGTIVKQAQEAGATRCLSKANCTPKNIVDAITGLLNSTASPAAGTASATNQGTDAASDEAVQKELRKSFLADLPGILLKLRSVLQALGKSAEGPSLNRALDEMHRQAHSLAGNSGMAGLPRIGHVSETLESFLHELKAKPGSVNASTVRSLALAVDFLGGLFEESHLPEALEPWSLSAAKVLVVDDEAISRRAVEFGLEKVRINPTVVEHPLTALDLISKGPFDLIFLDVNMPEMSGLELCGRIRAMPAQQKTPIIFVTSLNDFKTRAVSTISGGTDLIAKPFLFVELGLRALVYLFRK